MAFIAHRTSRGKKYWSIVESRRIHGRPRQIILEYLGTAGTLLKKLKAKDKISIKSYSHGDTAALLGVAKELDIVDIINKHIPLGKDGKKPTRDGLTVGASFLLAAIGRACHPTSKMGFYDWCKTTSLEYSLKTTLKNLDSQHFWDQMNFLPEEKIPLIEEEITRRLVEKYDVSGDTLLFDTSNFFTFIASSNERCLIAQRGKNKQKRNDLRQVGLALMVSRAGQFPLFHKTYEGNKHDAKVFIKIFDDLVGRLKSVFKELADVTLVFDKGNNSKDNFKKMDVRDEFHYVAGLVPSYFKKLIREANENFEMMEIGGEGVPVYRAKKKIWGAERTCVVTISKQLKEGQIRGIHQHLEKKYKDLDDFKKQLENPRKRKNFSGDEIRKRLLRIISGQFIEEILKYEIIKLENNDLSFTYYIDADAFEKLKKEVLGRKIVITNRHDWSSLEILSAYRCQSKVEYAFRNMKNPYHVCVRPQFHWTDQKIRAHFLMCVTGYLLVTAAYQKARRAGYRRNADNFLEDLRRIRLACVIKKGGRVRYQLEKMPKKLNRLATALGITDDQIRPGIRVSVYS